MNDSMTAHQFKIKEPNGWSTYCRTDDTLDADGVSYRKQTIDPLKGKPETGMNAAALGRDDRLGHPWARGPHAPTRHQPPGAATCHPKRCIRSKGNRRPEWMLRAYTPS